MSENKKTWNEKIKLILNELESRINAENAAADGIKKRKNKNKRNIKNSRNNKKLQKLQKREHHETEEMNKAELRRDIIMHAVMSVAFLLATMALIRGIARVLPNSVTVSNTVNGRELPIYCVETDKKQIALSFDAA